MERQPPADALPNLYVVTTTIDQDNKPAAHSGQRPTEPMCDEETQDRALLALGVAATSGFVKSVLSTEESCLTLCNTCRDKVPVPRLKVRHGVPPSIMQMVYSGVGQAKADNSSRVEPHRKVLMADWRFNDTQREGLREEPEVEAWDVDHTAVDKIDISKIQWPVGTTDVLLPFFNRRIDAMVWPPGLERLSFEHRRTNINRTCNIFGTFNMPLHAVTLPGGLREIFLGNHFNQPIKGVAWPRGLERLSLPGFSHSIGDVQWPPGLKSLEFVSPSDIGYWRCEDIDDRLLFADSDSSTEYLTRTIASYYKNGFNQPLGTTLPPSLETLWLPRDFHQPLCDVAWPSGITFLGFAFDSLYRFPGTIRWPPNLQRLCINEKPQPDDGFSFPPDCAVTILMSDSDFGGLAKYGHVAFYDPDEDPNDCFEDL